MRRLLTGIAGLDEMLGGGLHDGRITLIKGAPGTGKTTIGLQFLYAGATQANEPGVLFTFEQFPDQLLNDTASFGWNLEQLQEQNKLRLVFTSPEVLLNELETEGGLFERLVKEMGVSRVVVDSISHFQRIAREPNDLREIYFRLLNGFRREGLTCLLTLEDRNIMGLIDDGEAGLLFLADTLILLRYVEMGSEIHKALLVLKHRGSNHAKEIRRFVISQRGVNVESKFAGQQGVLTGNPTLIIPEGIAQTWKA